MSEAREPGWEAAFIATSVAIGESLEDAERALGPEAFVRAGEWVKLLRGTSSAKKGARANALALALAPVVRAIEEMELR